MIRPEKIVLYLLLFLGSAPALEAQVVLKPEESAVVSRVSRLPGREVFPAVALKTNLLYDLTTTFNLGLEFRLSDYFTLDISGNYNPWTFSNNRKWKHALVQPELRYWIYEPFNGHFLGMHGVYSRFNVGNIELPFHIWSNLNEYRYDGNAYGVGFSYGYQWILSPRWSMEASFGFGYLYMDYNRYVCKTCGDKVGSEYKHYFGPTKLAVSLIYIIK